MEQKNHEESNWSLNCPEHGNQIIPGSAVKSWDEETNQILRETGTIKNDETLNTAECPVCKTTLRVISEHTGPSSSPPPFSPTPSGEET